MLENPFYHEEDAKRERGWLRRAVVGPLLLLIAAGLAVCATKAQAEAIYQAIAEEGKVRIVLHKDKCEVKEIANLPLKAEWHEGTKSYQGCWGPRQDVGMIVAYFSDKTVALIPIEAFVKVSGI